MDDYDEWDHLWPMDICATCGFEGHLVFHREPLAPGDWQGSMPMCMDCWGDYCDKTEPSAAGGE